jgi:hypothetical protein
LPIVAHETPGVDCCGRLFVLHASAAEVQSGTDKPKNARRPGFLPL